MDVVDDQAERLGGGEIRAQPVEPVQDCERGIDARFTQVIGGRSSRKREQTSGNTGGASQELGTLGLRGIGKSRLEELTDDSEREIALELGPARAEHAHSARQRRSPRGRDQCRLADPGRPLDYDECAAPGASFGQRRFDPQQFLAPLEQRSRGRDSTH